MKCFRILAPITFAVLASFASAQTDPVVLVIFDGLRPDYVKMELMPNLAAFAKDNVVYNRHHAMYPTVTRVNAATIVTGCYPGTHGLMDNSVYIPEADPDNALSAADRANLEKIEAATGGKLLFTPTLGEILADNGKALFVASSGSTGSAFLLNHKVKAGAIVHCEYTLPASLDAHVKEVLGPVPPESTPDTAWNARVTDAYLKLNLDEMKAPVSILWYTDPDHTAHEFGVGTPKTKEALAGVDAEFGRLLAGIKERGLEGRINLLVASDHGFSTGIGKESLDKYVSDYLAEKGIDPKSVIRAGYGLYFKKDSEQIVPDLTMKLQQLPWIGAIFTAPIIPDTPIAANPGAIAFATIHYQGPRSPSIVVSPDWNDDVNADGFMGASTARGHGHGSSSIWDIHNTLIVGGPSFKRATWVDLPSGNIDLAPTLLRLVGLPDNNQMEGRVLVEALQGGPDATKFEPRGHTMRAQMAFPEGEGLTYNLELKIASFDGVEYLDYARATRIKGRIDPAQGVLVGGPGPGRAQVPGGVPAPPAPPAPVTPAAPTPPTQ